eukprot:scaffold58_cov115-Isochrysis_galbana.AAC.1
MAGPAAHTVNKVGREPPFPPYCRQRTWSPVAPWHFFWELRQLLSPQSLATCIIEYMEYRPYLAWVVAETISFRQDAITLFGPYGCARKPRLSGRQRAPFHIRYASEFRDHRRLPLRSGGREPPFPPYCRRLTSSHTSPIPLGLRERLSPHL